MKREKLKKIIELILIGLLSSFFIFAGVWHFLDTQFFIDITPPLVPYPEFVVYFTGICEIAGAIGLWFTRLRRLSAWCLMAYTIAVYPANIYMAMYPVHFAHYASRASLYIRLPFQFLILYLLWQLAKPKNRREHKKKP